MNTDKVPIPYFEAVGHDGKKLFKPKSWLERFDQYIERVYNTEIKPLINGTQTEITDETYKENETKIRKDFLWALGPTALHEMTTTEFGEKPEEMQLPRLIQVFKNYYTPLRNIYHSRGDFFWAKQKIGETPEQHWKKLCEIEKECEFKNITPAELMVSKFVTSITDTKLRDKILDEEIITVNTVMNRIKQDTYDKKYGKSFLPEPEIKKESEIQKIEKQYKKPSKPCHFCGKQNWNPEHQCPAKHTTCHKCGKKGHFAKVCKDKPQKKIQQIEEEWAPIQWIKPIQQIKERNYIKTNVQVNGQLIEFVVDTGSPITILPKQAKEKLKLENLEPVITKYQDVNKNEVKFDGKETVNVKTANGEIKLPLIISDKEDFTPLLGLDWFDALSFKIETNQIRRNSYSGPIRSEKAGVRIFTQ